MRRGPGTVQRQILALMNDEPDGVWSIDDLCRAVYSWRAAPAASKAQKVAVLRVLGKVVKDPWMLSQMPWHDGQRCSVLFNRASAVKVPAETLKAYEAALAKIAPVDCIRLRLAKAEREEAYARACLEVVRATEAPMEGRMAFAATATALHKADLAIREAQTEQQKVDALAASAKALREHKSAATAWSEVDVESHANRKAALKAQRLAWDAYQEATDALNAYEGSAPPPVAEPG
jgi:hypothetical protein